MLRIQNGQFLLIKRNVNLNVTAAGSDTVFFKPFPGMKLVVTGVRTVTKRKTGTVTTAPQWKLTNTSVDIVAAAAQQNTTEGAAANLTVVTANNVVTNALPLTFVETVKQIGGTKYTADIIVTGIFLTKSRPD